MRIAVKTAIFCEKVQQDVYSAIYCQLINGKFQYMDNLILYSIWA